MQNTMLKSLLLLASARAGATAAPRGPVGGVAVKADGFWYAAMDHMGDFRGRAPHLDDADSYDVFKTVEAGDGGAIQDAIDSGSDGNSRHNQWLASEPRVRATEDASAKT